MPVSAAAMTGDEIGAIFSGGEDIRALSARVLSVYASAEWRAAPRFTSAASATTDFDLAASQPVSIIMDDIVMENGR